MQKKEQNKSPHLWCTHTIFSVKESGGDKLRGAVTEYSDRGWVLLNAGSVARERERETEQKIALSQFYLVLSADSQEKWMSWGRASETERGKGKRQDTKEEEEKDRGRDMKGSMRDMRVSRANLCAGGGKMYSQALRWCPRHVKKEYNITNDEIVAPFPFIWKKLHSQQVSKCSLKGKNPSLNDILNYRAKLQ